MVTQGATPHRGLGEARISIQSERSLSEDSRKCAGAITSPYLPSRDPQLTKTVAKTDSPFGKRFKVNPPLYREIVSRAKLWQSERGSTVVFIGAGSARSPDSSFSRFDPRKSIVEAVKSVANKCREALKCPFRGNFVEEELRLRERRTRSVTE